MFGFDAELKIIVTREKELSEIFMKKVMETE